MLVVEFAKDKRTNRSEYHLVRLVDWEVLILYDHFFIKSVTCASLFLFHRCSDKGTIIIEALRIHQLSIIKKVHKLQYFLVWVSLSVYSTFFFLYDVLLLFFLVKMYVCLQIYSFNLFFCYSTYDLTD